MSNDSQKERLLSFLRLCRDKDDRATLANLRCALSETRKPLAWPILGRFGGIDDPAKEYDHHAKVVQTIAGLFATQPKDTSEGDFGSACLKLVDKDERKNMYNQREAHKTVGPVGKRFQLLLFSEREEICERVVRLLQRMKREEISVNYSELFDGLLYWGDKRKNRWAGSFWGSENMEEAAE
jgi:CRISPR type I-E-associated protein CasB/Cse2